MYSWASFDHEDSPNSLLCLLINIANFLNCLTGYIKYILLVLLSTTYLVHEVHRTICQAHTQMHIHSKTSTTYYWKPTSGRDPFEYQRISPVNQYLHPSTTTTPSTTASSYMHQPNPSRGSNRIHPIPNILNLYTFSHVKVRLFIMYYV